ncbi:WhiB family redox-sensing transcriptional regulator [Herbihabitans rhizosphaerae]|uniref:WhiB family redox-sensing transcriptional regulator n=1 Tax=Herbihabitans rhizosphaerae TaxID=1872711 RepID=A0A4Q7KE27_9PSEU|nr:WhiB family transcriptional regulator [Herbihabitans rhizosphaerae]RZS32494.1 WhiB family redox-sensing transcriptional regulator [Herbihabitans rhizosphaerae]
MNEYEEEFSEVVADLDQVEDVPTDDLFAVLSRDGACMWVRTTGEEPQWTGDDRVDRALAAPICGGCPVRRECLEFEFRTSGYALSGVWGPLSEEERRAAFVVWLDRRDGLGDEASAGGDQP